MASEFYKRTATHHSHSPAMTLLPAAIITPSLLTSIRRHPNLPRNTWYFVAATALSILNRPDEIHKVYKHAIENGPSHIDIVPSLDEQLRITRRMREALVKAAAIGGLPKVCHPWLH